MSDARDNRGRFPDKVEIKTGFGKHIKTRAVEVAEGDAPPWDATTKYNVVGTDHDRVDGLMKATGRAKYSYDVNFPDMLQGMILRSPIPRGKLSGLELDEARKMPGVGAVIALKDIGNRVRFVGDEVAAVAAPTLDMCRDAIEKIRATFDEEAHTVDFMHAEEGPMVDEAGDLILPWDEHEKIETALTGAAHQHSGTYRTEVQTHSSLETHGAVARWTGADLELWCSTQATFGVRGELNRAMRAADIECESVTVHAEFVGGGFGSKFTSGAEGRAVALLAKEASAPVKLMLDRFEEHTCTGNRPAALMQIRAGLDPDGIITTWDWRSFGGVGHNGRGGRVSFPSHFLTKTGEQQGQGRRRRRARQRTAHQDVATDTDPARPMRAPGHPQGFFGAELFLDELAVKAGIDPLELRQKNDTQVIRQEQYRVGAERFGWAKARNPAPGKPMAGDEPRYLRGAGMASARWGGLGGSGRGGGHGILCRIHSSGDVETRSGAQDIGSGMKTVMAMVTAEELGISTDRVKATMGHTSDPSGPASGGSTTTPSLAPAVRNAALLARLELAELIAQKLGVPADRIECKDGTIGSSGTRMPWSDACKLIGPNPIEVRGRRFPNYRDGQPFEQGVCGVQFAEVLVDSWTGLVRVSRMLAVQDCGLVIAKKTAESQVIGAMIQGIGYALHEQKIMDPQSGRMLNGDFLRYKVPGPRDMPEMECMMWSVANGHSNTGAAGVGEPPSVAAPAAVANAVYNAIGAPVRHLPIMPDKVLTALQQRKGD